MPASRGPWPMMVVWTDSGARVRADTHIILCLSFGILCTRPSTLALWHGRSWLFLGLLPVVASQCQTWDQLGTLCLSGLLGVACVQGSRSGLGLSHPQCRRTHSPCSPDPASQEAGTEVTMWFPPPCLCPQQLPVSTVGGLGALSPALPGAILCVQVVTRQNTAHPCGPGQAGPSRSPMVPPGSPGCLEGPGRGRPRARGGEPARGPWVLLFSLLLGGLSAAGKLNSSVS